MLLFFIGCFGSVDKLIWNVLGDIVVVDGLSGRLCPCDLTALFLNLSKRRLLVDCGFHACKLQRIRVLTAVFVVCRIRECDLKTDFAFVVSILYLYWIITSWMEFLERYFYGTAALLAVFFACPKEHLSKKYGLLYVHRTRLTLFIIKNINRLIGCNIQDVLSKTYYSRRTIQDVLFQT
jgi:hypothetical protein